MSEVRACIVVLYLNNYRQKSVDEYKMFVKLFSPLANTGLVLISGRGGAFYR